MTPHEIRQLCEHTEAEGWAGLFNHSGEDFAAQVGMSVMHWGDGISGLICSKIGSTLFNRVMGIGVDAPLTETLLDEMISDYATAGVSHFALQICPDAQPAPLREWLAERGFTRGGDWAKCYRPATPPHVITTDLRVAEIGVDQRESYGRTLCAGYEMPEVMMPLASGAIGHPGWHNYMAFDADQPVAIAALYIDSEVGWLGGGATVPAYRQRGGQGALMAQRIEDGIALGCKWFVTETGAERPDHPNPSYHNMLRTGFQLAYLRTDYLSPPL